MSETGTAIRRTDLEETAVDRARDAIERGEAEAGIAALEQVVQEAKPIHDLYGDMCASLLTFISDTLGEDAVVAATRHMSEDVWRPVLEMFAREGETEAFVRVFADFLISHRYDYSAWELDDRWVFDVSRCTSGERMIREGKVRDQGEGGDPRFGTISNRFKWASDVERVPNYDVHWMWMSDLPREYGWPIMDVEYGRRPDGTPSILKVFIFKQPRGHA